MVYTLVGGGELMFVGSIVVQVFVFCLPWEMVRRFYVRRLLVSGCKCSVPNANFSLLVHVML
jgi:hypothetical protein